MLIDTLETQKEDMHTKNTLIKRNLTFFNASFAKSGVKVFYPKIAYLRLRPQGVT
jgi:hypothetical protein